MTTAVGAPALPAPPRFRDLCGKLSGYLDREDARRVYRAYLFGAERHAGQHRASGEPYITHPLAVAEVLADQRLDADTLCAALLHDVIEDTPTVREQIEKDFGSSVAHLVDGVSKLQHLGESASRGEAQAANFSKMMLAAVQDLRVILVKLADRLHNLRTLDALESERRERIARETLEVYVPIARRLGMNSICMEYEQRVFEVLHPVRSRVLAHTLQRVENRHREKVEQIHGELRKCLEEYDIEARVESRQKGLYSIYRKMQEKRLSFQEVFDVYGFRIIVDRLDDCYRALGVVHNLYKPVPGRFKDYIAIPKNNGYQSLHTGLFGPGGVPLEIQIRTRAMDRVAESGVAAHWRYKGEDSPNLLPHAEDWMRSLHDLKSRTPDSAEFLEHVKVDLFPHEVYVFTPAGEILRLPKGATALDFAYAVHSDVGNSCTGVSIDRTLVPLDTELASGQTVEVQTDPSANPSPAWLDFVATGKARASIRQYLKGLREEQAEEPGRHLLERALGRLQQDLEQVPEERMTEVCASLGAEGPAQLFSGIGLGRWMAPVVAHQLAGSVPGTQRTWLNRMLRRYKEQPLALQGTEGLAVNLAKCCRPIPGDEVFAMVTAGHGLVVHRDRCPNVGRRRGAPGQKLPLEWEENVEGEYSVAVQVITVNRRGLLARIATAIAEQKSNIIGVTLDEQQAQNISMTFVLDVRDRTHLAAILRAVRKVPNVHRAGRLLG